MNNNTDPIESDVQVDTRGGAFVAGNINAEGNVALRDIYRVTNNHFQGFLPEQSLFLARMTAYNKLHSELRNAVAITHKLFDETELSPKDKETIAIQVGLSLAELTDQESFYLDHSVTIQAIGAFIGLEDIFAITEDKARQAEIDKFHKHIRIAYRMIESVRDTGTLDLSITSPLIEYFRERKMIQDVEDQAF